MLTYYLDRGRGRAEGVRHHPGMAGKRFTYAPIPLTRGGLGLSDTQRRDETGAVFSRSGRIQTFVRGGSGIVPIRFGYGFGPGSDIENLHLINKIHFSTILNEKVPYSLRHLT